MTATMKRTVLALALIAAGTVSSVGSAHAEWYGNSSGREIDVRQHNQAGRIKDGIRDGSLTRHEARELIVEQRRVAEVERRSKADGYVDPAERARLRAMQDRASKHIAAERHDSETQYSRPWYRRWW
jgi:hypothetical protein